MKNLFVIVLLGIVTVSPIRASNVELQSKPPVLKIYEVDENNKIIRPYDGGEIKPTGVIIDNVKHIRLVCIAYYPVQWVYEGNGVPVLTSNIEVSTTQENNANQYIARAFLSPLNERHTGSYRCSHTDSYTKSPFIHIYVPGTNLFTSEEGKTIQVLDSDTSILIPCSVSHPEVKVSLEKLTKTGLEVPAVKSDDAITYSPKKGFRINLNKIVEPYGTYVCLAHFKDIVRGVDYRLAAESRSENIELLPTPAEGSCQDHIDCPKWMHCYNDRRCRDPCTYSIRCGKEAKCRLKSDLPGAHPECYCDSGFGDPTKECFNP